MHLSWTPHSSTRHIARVLIFFALLAGWLTGVPSWAGVVQDVRVQGDRVVIRFNEPVRQASSFVLVGPQRVAIDIDGATPGSVVRAGGAVMNIRQGVRDGSN